MMGLGVGGSLRIGGQGSGSPMVNGATTPAVSVAQAAYGAGSTSSSSPGGGLFGFTPGHLTIYAGGLAVVLLVLIRHSLPK